MWFLNPNPEPRASVEDAFSTLRLSNQSLSQRFCRLVTLSNHVNTNKLAQ